ncbi:MAG: GDP-mannose 4,6-dehydratase [Candidatus Roizmanbacteria bacterium]|nr:GDP-mannose 4,6-dehydratase [Candidatus Roizmanbacteria bacterium]
MKKILITGGTGFVGSNVVRRLVQDGYKPIVLIRTESNLWRIQDILSNVKLLKTDILNCKSLIEDIKTINPTHILHLAVYGAYQSTQKDLNKTLETNIIGTSNLLTAATVLRAGIDDKKIQLSDPNFVRDFIYVDDVVDAYMYFLSGKKYYGEIINIGSGKQTRLGDFVELAETIIGKKIQIEWSEHSSNQCEPKKWQADISKAQVKLGWHPQNTLEMGIKKSLEFYKSEK